MVGAARVEVMEVQNTLLLLIHSQMKLFLFFEGSWFLSAASPLIFIVSVKRLVSQILPLILLACPCPSFHWISF